MPLRASLSIALPFVFLVGCGEPTPPPATPPAPAPPASAAGAEAPHPTSIEELRAGCPAGRVIELRLAMSGKPVLISRMEFVKVDDHAATIKETTRTEEGKVVSEDTGTTEWAKLYAHASFPAAETKIESAAVTVPAGSFQAKLYTVTHGKTVKRFWFAEGLAGPPVRFTTDEDGQRVFEGTMIASSIAKPAPREPEKPVLVPTRKLPVTNGTFVCARRTAPNGEVVSVTVNEVADTVIPRDHRAPAEVPPYDRNEFRLVLPLSQIGVTKDKQGLVLVEARDRGKLKTAKGDDAAEVTWFTATASHPLAPAAGAAASWRIWKGEGQPAIEPDVLSVEDASGKIVALRLLGAQRGVTPLAIDPSVPMFLVTILDHASGSDDPILFKVVALLDGDLKELLVVEGGYRSNVPCKEKSSCIVGPAGSVVLAQDGGKPVLRARRISAEKGGGASCTPGGLTYDGCAAEELTFRWNTSTHAFDPGPAKPIKLKQDGPNKPIRVLP